MSRELQSLLSDINPIDVRAELFRKRNFDFIVKGIKDGKEFEHAKQRKALEILTGGRVTEFLFGGAANGAKTWTGCVWLMFMCICYPGTRWFVARNELKDLVDSVLVTFKKVSRTYGFSDYRFNAVKNFIEFGNGSHINFIEIKRKPTDPLFEDLGSTEYTGGWIEEVGEIDERGASVISKRAGRHFNDKYGIKKMVFYTCNPKKNWAKREFYDKYKSNTLESHKAFLQSLVIDNPFREEGSAEDLESYRLTDKVLYERLYKGNWDYEDNPYQLADQEMIENIFTNVIEGGKRYITADIARFGSDKARIGYWEGWDLKEVISLDISKTTDIELAIRTLRFKYKVPRTRTIGDADGVGCLHQNTEVLTKTGWKKAKNLKISDYLISKDSEGRIQHRNPRELFFLDQERFIETEGGYLFTETHAHFYKTRKEHQIKTAYWDDVTEFKAFYNDTYVSIEEMDEYDTVLIPSTKGHDNTLLITRETFAYFLGWMSSDGSIDGWNNKHVIRISQAKSSPNVPKIEAMLNDMGIKWIRKFNGKNLYQFEFQHKALFNWIKSEGYFGKPNFETKKVPDWIKKEPKKIILKYIESFLEGDGYYHKENMQFTGTNKKLLDGIQELLFYCGIRSKFYVSHKKGSVGKIDGREIHRKRDCYLLSEVRERNFIRVGKTESFFAPAVNIMLGNETKAYLVRMQDNIFWTHNGGVIDGANITGFNNNARPIRQGSKMPNYRNLQVQCLYHLADKINNAEIKVSADLTGKERDEIKEELSQIQSKGDHEPDRKLDCKSKADIKSDIGRSPDWRDLMLMRSFFDLKKGVAELKTIWN